MQVRYRTTDTPFVSGNFFAVRDADGDVDGIYVVPEALNASWTAAHYIDTRSGRPTIIEIRIVPRDDLFAEHPRDDRDPASVFENILGHEPRRDRVESPLTARLLQKLRPGRAVDELQAVAQQVSLPSRASVGISAEMLQARPSRGRRDRRARDVWLSRVAMVYVAAVDDSSASPVRDARNVLNDAASDQPPLSVNAVRDLLKAARDEELLERPTPGKRHGGRLTPKAEHLLATEAATNGE
jgi:hypothetical protein